MINFDCLGFSNPSSCTCNSPVGSSLFCRGQPQVGILHTTSFLLEATRKFSLQNDIFRKLYTVISRLLIVGGVGEGESPASCDLQPPTPEAEDGVEYERNAKYTGVHWILQRKNENCVGRGLPPACS